MLFRQFCRPGAQWFSDQILSSGFLWSSLLRVVSSEMQLQLAAETKGNQPESFTICIHVPMIIRILYICHEIFHISYNIQDFNPTYKKYQNIGMIRTLPRSSVLRLGRSMTQRMPSSWWGKLSARPPSKQIKNTSSFIMCWQCNYITLQGANISHLGNRKIIDSKVH